MKHKIKLWATFWLFCKNEMIIHHSPLITHHSPLITHPLVTHPSSLTHHLHPSSLTPHHLPLITHSSSLSSHPSPLITSCLCLFCQKDVSITAIYCIFNQKCAFLLGCLRKLCEINLEFRKNFAKINDFIFAKFKIIS